MSPKDDPARKARRGASKIGQFCEANGISRAQYFALRQQGKGPDEIRLGGQTVLISDEAAAAWRKKYTVKASAKTREREDTAA